MLKVRDDGGATILNLVKIEMLLLGKKSDEKLPKTMVDEFIEISEGEDPAEQEMLTPPVQLI